VTYLGHSNPGLGSKIFLDCALLERVCVPDDYSGITCCGRNVDHCIKSSSQQSSSKASSTLQPSSKVSSSLQSGSWTSAHSSSGEKPNPSASQNLSPASSSVLYPTITFFLFIIMEVCRMFVF